jgi:Tol biopolymer transport system component
MGIFEAKRENEDYAVPVLVVFEGKTVPASNPCVSPDGKFMIFSADLNIGKGGSDLYVSFRREGEWRFPIGVPGVNTAAAEFAPAIDPDGKYLYFTSERTRPGEASPARGARPPGDIYRIRLSTIHGLAP